MQHQDRQHSPGFWRKGRMSSSFRGQRRLRLAQLCSHSFVLRLIIRLDQYLKENLGAGSLKLTSEEITEIRQIAEETEIPGERYGPGFFELTYVESPALK